MQNIGMRKWWAIVALTLAGAAVGLDMTVLNLALPTLAVDLHASTSELMWFVDSYSLVLAAIMLPGGMLGDRFGRKKVLLISLALFGLGSLACAYSATSGVFITARVLLGLGAAALLPLSMSILPVLFDDKERPKALALLMIGNFIAFPLGPILGGWLLTHYQWGSVFLINVPVVALAILAVAFLLPESRGAERRKLDLAGILLSSAGLVGFTYGIIEAGDKGWGNGTALSTLIAGIILLIGFVWWEKRSTHPLVELSLFRSAGFTWGSLLTTLATFAMMGVLFTVPQYYQEVVGTDALGAGVRLLPLVGGLLLSAPIADKLVALIGVKAVVALGFLLLIAGLVMGAGTSLHSSTAYAVAWLAIIGAGMGVAMPSTMDAAIGELSAERSGVGSALISALKQVGSSIGVAILGSILNMGYRSQLKVAELPATAAAAVKKGVTGGVKTAQLLHQPVLLDSVRNAFVYGMDLMLWVCGGIALLATLLSLVYLPQRNKAPVHEAVQRG